MTKSEDDGSDPDPVSAELMPRVPGQMPLTRISARTVTAVIVAIAIFLYLVRAILLPFVISGVLAYVCTPLIERVAARTRLPRWLVATAVALLILTAFGAFALLAVPLLVGEVGEAVANLKATIERVVQWWFGAGSFNLLGRQTTAAELAQHAVEGLRNSLAEAGALATLASNAVSDVVELILSVVLLVYFMIGGPSIAASLFWLVPPRQRPLIHAVWEQLDPVLIRYFIGIGVVVIYATMMAYLGLGLVLHLQNAAVLALVTGLLETVPVVGPIGSAVIAGLAALRAATGVGAVVAYAVYAVALRLSIDQVVSPLVLGRAGRVHPVLIIFCFLAGGLLFNIVGIILAIPVALAIKVILATLYEEPLDPAHPETSKAVPP